MPTTDINLNLSYVESIVAGTNITVDDTDPQNPIVSASGGSGITYAGTVNYIPKAATDDGGGNILTMDNSRFYDDGTTVLYADAGTAGKLAANNATKAIGLYSQSSDSYVYVDSDAASTYNGTRIHSTIQNAVTGKHFSFHLVAGITDDTVPIFSPDTHGTKLVSSAVTTTQLTTLSTGAGGGVRYLSSDNAGLLTWQSVSGGGTTTNPLTIGTGLSGTSFDGSAPITIQIDSTVATLTGTQTLTNKTLTSPVIGAIVGLNGQIAHTTTAQASGAIIDYLFTPSNHTGQTASTNAPMFRVASSTKTFATGTIAAFYANHFQTQTIAFASASTVTESFGAYFESNTLGSLATFTNSYSLGTNGFVKLGQGLMGTIIRNDVSTNNYTTFYNANITPSSTNYFIKNNSSTTFVNAVTGGILYLTYNGTSVISISSTTAMTIAEGVTTNAGTTTGWKLCGSTTQKMALWNKTPIVQPTTAITGATLVSNAGTTITSTDTFGGYTLQQIAAALVNFGLLA